MNTMNTTLDRLSLLNSYIEGAILALNTMSQNTRSIAQGLNGTAFGAGVVGGLSHTGFVPQLQAGYLPQQQVGFPAAIPTASFLGYGPQSTMFGFNGNPAVLAQPGVIPQGWVGGLQHASLGAAAIGNPVFGAAGFIPPAYASPLAPNAAVNPWYGMVGYGAPITPVIR